MQPAKLSYPHLIKKRAANCPIAWRTALAVPLLVIHHSAGELLHLLSANDVAS
jgi:hypothetical protein